MTGFPFARSVANNAINLVAAYKKFLRSKHIRIKKISSSSDFANLPTMEKGNYLSQYRLTELFPNGKRAPMAYASSGSSGKPTFWFRGDEQEKAGGDMHELIFSKVFGISKDDSALIVICFSMGVWVAGNYTLAAFREVARRGYNITVITPGIDKADIFSSLQVLAPKYKHVILAGYPPFVMDVVLEAKARRIKLSQSVKILTAGEKFSEDWRDEMAKMIKARPADVVSIYGCADVGVLGIETPLSIFIRRKALANKALRAEIFGDSNEVPAFVQYDPAQIYFESINTELVFTTRSAIPLIRYNIHDVGSVISSKEMMDTLYSHGIKLPKHLEGWDWPFVIKKLRTDVSLTFYALNIYPEHLNECVKDNLIAKYTGGNYFAYSKNTRKNRSQEFHLSLQAKSGKKLNKAVAAAIQKRFVTRLSQINIEYRKLVEAIGKKAYPIIKFSKDTDWTNESKGGRGLLSANGKKPKVIL